MTTEKTKNAASEMLDEGWKNYEQALRSGLKYQEEAGRWWTRMFGQAASPQDFQKQLNLISSDLIPAARKSLEDCLEVLDQNSRTGVDLMKKGLDAAQSLNHEEKTAKAAEFWEGSMKSLKANTQAMIDINTKAMDAWFGFLKKAATVPETRAEKA
jgi:hypothetical protein